MAKFSETEQISYRYGLDELPADITHRELLYFFSFNPTERQFAREKGRFPAHQVVLGIHLAAYRLIGRPQYYPEKTPSVIIQHVADSLKLGGDVVPLIYSDRERTRRDHIKIARKFMGLDLFNPANHQLLIGYLIQNAPDPGHIPAWLKRAEDFLRTDQFVLPTVKVLRRLILSARNQAMENAVSHIIREKDPELRLCVVSAINLMILCLAIWNTIYMQRAIRSLKEEGYQINQEDLGLLSPFGHAHINLYGQFFFQPFPGMDSSAARKEFEPLF